MTPHRSSPAAAARVLVVDDNDEARRMLEVRVRREGYDVVVAENGRLALAALRTQPIDMVLLDLYMPELSGFDVLRTAKADAALADIPVVVISGGGDQEDLVRCIELGAVDFLPKPYNQAVLRARLTTCIATKQRRDQERLRPEAPAAVPLSPVPLHGPAHAPQRLGRIVIRSALGRGSVGQVFLGHHELLDLPVAVKVLHPELQHTPEMRGRILREARLAARLAHRNVVRLLEVGETAAGIYLAYEYVNGGTLEALLERRPGRQLEVATAVAVTRSLAAALAEINRLGITHRDLKPANVLLTQEGRVKLADLGLARQYGGDDDSNLTGEHTVVGTPVYMAPEQARGQKDLDIRCDLYALGVVLYEMLTGRPPFDRKSSMAMVLAHMCMPVPPPSSLRDGIPPWLERVCLKLLAKERDDRYPSPDALLNDLRERAG